jgi:hypothetical protein
VLLDLDRSTILQAGVGPIVRLLFTVAPHARVGTVLPLQVKRTIIVGLQAQQIPSLALDGRMIVGGIPERSEVTPATAALDRRTTQQILATTWPGERTASDTVGAAAREAAPVELRWMAAPVETVVELVFFSGQADGGVVILEWVTRNEVGNREFHVYRGRTTAGVYQRMTGEPVTGLESYRWVDEQVEVGLMYFYKIEAIEVGGAGTFYGPVEVRVEEPKTFALEPNAPNPFNLQTVIRYQVPVPSRVALKVYTLLGQVVTTLVEGEVPAGYHSVVWDGRDRFKREVASGIYVYRLTSEHVTVTRKMLLLK